MSRRRFLACAAASLGSVSAEAAWHEPHWLKTEHVRIPSRRDVGHRLVQLTDIHYKGDATYLSQVVARINVLKPDSVCFTGDLVEDREFVAPALKILSRINAPLYGIPGNHDYWAHVDFAEYVPTFARAGGKWLMDESVSTADGKLHIVGATCTRGATFNFKAGMKNVLLLHYPAWAKKISQPVDLMLAGHSHGGQVRLPGWGSLVVPFDVGEYDMGLFETPAGPLYVNPGIGYFYADIRFCCRPEITVFDL